MASKTAFTRTIYDENAYKHDLYGSTGPMRYQTDVGRFENDSRCNQNNPETNGYTNPSEGGEGKMGRVARVVDTESDLRLLSYPLTRDPAGKYLPKPSPQTENYVDCAENVNPTYYSRLDNDNNDVKEKSFFDLVTVNPLKNYQSPLWKQGYIEPREMFNMGAMTRNNAKDQHSSIPQYRKEVNMEEILHISPNGNFSEI